MYLGKKTNVLICFVNRSQTFAVAEIVRGFPGSFAVLSQVNEVYGNFKNLNKNGKAALELLDPGDGNLI